MGWCKREKKMREKERYGRGRRSLYRRGRGGRRRNKGSVLKVLMCVELRRLGVNRQFLVEGVYMDDRRGERGTLMVLTVAGGEAAVGLAVLVVYYRVHGTIAMESMNVLHG